MKYIVGVDEVGRGPVAGPVTVCVFIMPEGVDVLQYFKNRTLRDSKKLSASERQRIRTALNKTKLAGLIDFVIISKSAEYIDKHGIAKSLQMAIEQGLRKLISLNYNLDKKNCQIQLDGSLKLSPKFLEKTLTNNQQNLSCNVNVRGDENIAAIACASILAKVARDRYMQTLGQKLYDQEAKWYNWASNAGYGTKEHYELIEKHGLSQQHRKTFLKKLL